MAQITYDYVSTVMPTWTSVYQLLHSTYLHLLDIVGDDDINWDEENHYSEPGEH